MNCHRTNKDALDIHVDLNDDPTQARPSGDDQSSQRSDKPSDQASDQTSDKASDTPSDHDHSTGEEAEGLDHARAIRELNDAFRQSFAGGAVLMTAGIINLGRTAQRAILEKVRAFTQFDTGNDPYHEHDFGALTHDGEQIFFKIDYYDADLCHGSPDPADPSITRRVLTIMLASDY